ncbi:MAG: GAF domain-containing protein [Caldilineaceae bacterium]
MSQTVQRVLYVADPTTATLLMQNRLQEVCYHVDLAKDNREALAMLKQSPYDLVAFDQNLSISSGLPILQFLAAQKADLSVVTIATPSPATLSKALEDAQFKANTAGEHPELPITLGSSTERLQFEREREQTLEELRQHNRNLALLNKVAQLLTSTLDINEVINQLVRTITELIDIEGSSVWLVEEGGTGNLICAAIFSEGKNIIPKGLSLPPGRGIAGWVVQHGQSANVADVAVDPRFFSTIDQSTGFNTQSILAVPLHTSNKIVGVLELVNKRGGPFLENDCTLAETLAASAAIALENARLLQTFRQSQEELQARNDELDAYAHTVAHDLKNPLTMIIGFADLLRDSYNALPPENLALCLDAIVEHGMKMSNIIDALLKLAGVRGAEKVKLEQVDMGAVITETLKRMDLMLREHGAVITEPDHWPLAQGYGPWLEEVWYNYLSNGLKYGGTPPRLELGYDLLENDTIRFWVKDNGPGLQISDPATLFSPMQGTVGERKRNGHGLGLSIVQRIVRRLEGAVGVESTPGHGSRFYFTLPTPPANNNQ